MQLKDYYRTLGVGTAATQAGIKKTFRALAVKYHPDKNPGNDLAEAQFKEIQEAYAILSDATRRNLYDEERRLSGMGGNSKRLQAVTPAWLLSVSQELNTSLATIDTYRMSQGALQAYILLILSDAHLAVLRQHAEIHINHSIVKELLLACRRLEARYIPPIEQRLVMLGHGDNELMQSIKSLVDHRVSEARRDTFLPYVVIIITILLCMLMYVYSAWK